MDEESFVYSVPFYDEDAEGKKILFQNLPVIGVKSNFFCILHLYMVQQIYRHEGAERSVNRNIT
jgi:hypothetical protein